MSLLQRQDAGVLTPYKSIIFSLQVFEDLDAVVKEIGWRMKLMKTAIRRWLIVRG